MLKKNWIPTLERLTEQSMRIQEMSVLLVTYEINCQYESRLVIHYEVKGFTIKVCETGRFDKKPGPACGTNILMPQIMCTGVFITAST